MRFTLLRSRKVFYLPGFDPMPARKYREIYREESRRQAEISGYRINQTSAPESKGHWHITSMIDAQQVVSDYRILEWSDIVKNEMGRGSTRLYFGLANTALIYFSTGVFFRLSMLRRGPIIAAVFPPLFLIAKALLPIGIFATPILYAAQSGPSLTNAILSISLGAICAGLLWRWLARLDKKLYASYLAVFYNFLTREWGALPKALDARISEFEDIVKDALQSDADEVLIIGHSFGVVLAIHVAARVLKRGQIGLSRPNLSLLTLASVAPMMSFLPEASELRRDLLFLSQNENLTWADYSSTYDPGGFALCDPVKVTGLSGANPQKWPKMLSINFSESLSKAQLRRQNFRFFERHLQYLCAFAAPSRYDYFYITSGPKTLSEYISPLNESPSVKKTAYSAYRNV